MCLQHYWTILGQITIKLGNRLLHVCVECKRPYLSYPDQKHQWGLLLPNTFISLFQTPILCHYHTTLFHTILYCIILYYTILHTTLRHTRCSGGALISTLLDLFCLLRLGGCVTVIAFFSGAGLGLDAAEDLLSCCSANCLWNKNQHINHMPATESIYKSKTFHTKNFYIKKGLTIPVLLVRWMSKFIILLLIENRKSTVKNERRQSRRVTSSHETTKIHYTT